MTEPTDWDWVRAMLLIRCGGRCEITGDPLEASWTSHHRRPRGMGGTRRADKDSLANLIAVNGHGTAGAHGWAEAHRADALARGILVPQALDPALVPLVLWSGRRVLLDPDDPWYRDTTPAWWTGPLPGPAANRVH